MCFSSTNQKPERQRPFGTGLVRHCPQGLFSPFFTFLRAIYFSARLDFPSSPLSAPGSLRIKVGISLKTTPLDLVPVFVLSCNLTWLTPVYDGHLALVTIESLLDMVGFMYMSPKPPQRQTKVPWSFFCTLYNRDSTLR